MRIESDFIFYLARLKYIYIYRYVYIRFFYLLKRSMPVIIYIEILLASEEEKER